jgi:hypothetical protein
VIVNLSITAASGSGWNTGISMLKDNSTSSNLVEIPWVSGTQSPLQIHYYDGNIYSRTYPTGNRQFRFIGQSAVPTTGNRSELGDMVYNSIPEPGGNMGWVCTTAGNPGTWKPFGMIGV